MSHDDQQPDERDQKKASTEKLSILLIDDDYEFFETIKQMAKSSSLELDYAPDGFTAFRLVKRKTYDAIVSDVNMPFMNGLALITEFQKKNLDIPFVLISSTISDQISRDAFRVGAYNVLQKPFMIDDLQKKVKIAVDVHRSQDVERLDSQEKAYIYNSLKAIYYDADKILGKVRKYNIPISIVTEELEKKDGYGEMHVRRSFQPEVLQNFCLIRLAVAGPEVDITFH